MIRIWWFFAIFLIDCQVDNWPNFKQYYLIKSIIYLIKKYFDHVSSKKHEREYDNLLIFWSWFRYVFSLISILNCKKCGFKVLWILVLMLCLTISYEIKRHPLIEFAIQWCKCIAIVFEHNFFLSFVGNNHSNGIHSSKLTYQNISVNSQKQCFWNIQ